MKEYVEKMLAESYGAWRFRWVAVGTAWVVCLFGWTTVSLLPDAYEARAQIYVDSSSILTPLLQGIAVTANTTDEANVVRRALLGRPNLEHVARETKLLERAKSPKQAERLVQQLAEDIRIVGDGKVSIYTITFEDRVPAMALNVVQRLLGSFVEDQQGASRADTQGAENFLREQLADYEERLNESEQRLATFKKANVGLMPDQRGDYFARLQNEMVDAEKVETQLAVAIRQRDELRTKLAAEGAGPRTAPSASQVLAATQLDARISESRRQLDELLLRFTDKHPDVISLRDTIERLEERRREQFGAVRQTRAMNSLGAGVVVDTVVQNLQIALNNADLQVTSLQAQAGAVRKRIAELRRLVTHGPEVEAELARLTRDYGVTKTQYEALLQRFESARISGQAGRESNIKFRTIEPPRVSIEPVGPERALVLVFVLVVALVIGVIVAFVANLLRPVFVNTSTLREATGLPVIGVVSEYLPIAAFDFRRREALATVGAAVILVLYFFLLVLPATKGFRASLGLD